MVRVMNTRLHICLATAAIMMVMGVVSPVSAQIPLTSPADEPAELTREALASPYGRAMVAEFTSVLKASADLACLQSKNIKPEQLAQRGDAFVTRWSVHAMEILATYINLSIYETKLAQSAGVGAAAELKRLQANADVKRYLAIDRPRRLAFVLDYVFEQFGRYVLINRIKLGQVSPFATGNETLLRANPTEKAEADLEKFLYTNKSAQVRRYLELNEQATAALTASLNTDQVRNNLGPTTLFRGAEKDLAQLCVGGPQ
jgi:hypothetical protein